jgi:gliding motility-associated-like protein
LIIDPSTGEILVDNSQPGNYTVTYSVNGNVAACQNPNSSSIPFVIRTPFNVGASGQCQGSAFVLTASPIENSFDPTTVSYTWLIGNDIIVGSNSQSINATATGIYTVIVTSNGCTSSAQFEVVSIGCEIQKGISANNDGLNDNFELSGFGVKRLEIFNRYGLKVYTKSNYTNEWFGQTDNGDELPDGTYYYVIEFNAAQTKTGWIYITREK